MACLACVYAESDVSEQVLRPDPKLRGRAVHHRWYAEDLLRIKGLLILKTSAINPVEMLVRPTHNPCPRDSAHETQEMMGNISEYRPGTDVAHSWKAAIGLPWDPFDSCVIHTRRELVCPKCGVVAVARQSAHNLT